MHQSLLEGPSGCNLSIESVPGYIFYFTLNVTILYLPISCSNEGDLELATDTINSLGNCCGTEVISHVGSRVIFS